MTDGDLEADDFDLTLDIREQDVVEGERIGVSPLTGDAYLVTKWIEPPADVDDGNIRAVEKTELDDLDALDDDVADWVREQREQHDVDEPGDQE